MLSNHELSLKRFAQILNKRIKLCIKRQGKERGRERRARTLEYDWMLSLAYSLHVLLANQSRRRNLRSHVLPLRCSSAALSNLHMHKPT